MGLIDAAVGAASGVLSDQWREYFYCEALDNTVLVKKGAKRQSKSIFNRNSSDNIITNGSIIAVNEGQCMIIVEQGEIVEVCSQAGEFLYDSSTEPTILYGDLGEGLKKSFETFKRRFTFGGEPAKDQRVYYFNTKILLGNKYGTASPVPFRVVDNNIGLDIDISIRCHGEYAYRIIDPIVFYKNVCGNVESEYRRETIDSQLKSELLNVLQPAFARISTMGIRYSALPGHTTELSQVLDELLSQRWGEQFGIKITSFAVGSVKAPEEDEQMIKELQRNAVLRNPTMAAAHLVGAQAGAMQAAAANESAGPMMAFAGMNMAGAAGGMNAGNLFAMGAQQAPPPTPQAPPPQAAAPAGWTCACGTGGNQGKFCMECGKPQPAPADSWACACGTAGNKGKFCMECGKPRPAGVARYKCSRCNWEPQDPNNVPKFCPECGDPFDDGDVVR